MLLMPGAVRTVHILTADPCVPFRPSGVLHPFDCSWQMYYVFGFIWGLQSVTVKHLIPHADLIRRTDTHVLCALLSQPPLPFHDSPSSHINFQLAKAIRRAPVVANILLGGVDKGTDGKCEASLYWMDYLGTQQKVTFTANSLVHVELPRYGVRPSKRIPFAHTKTRGRSPPALVSSTLGKMNLLNSRKHLATLHFLGLEVLCISGIGVLTRSTL